MMPINAVDAMPLTRTGLGGAQLGNLGMAISEEQAHDLVDAAWSAGIRYFDTAPHYGLGLSERRLGQALSSKPRHEYVLSTKVGRLLLPEPRSRERDDEGFDVPATFRRQWGFDADSVRRSLDDSLERLGLDRVDIVYVHDPDDHLEQAIREALPALALLRDQGVVGAIGAGMNSTAPLTRIVTETDVDVVMCAGRYTLLEQGALDDLLPAATLRGVDVIAAGVFNSGLLSRHTVSATASYNYGTAPAALVEKARRIAETCHRHGVTLPQAALAYPLRHHAVVSEVLGMSTRTQVESNAADSDVSVPEALWIDLSDQGLLAGEHQRA